jgi:hypothetical protein
MFQLGNDSASHPLRWIFHLIGLGEFIVAVTAWFGLRKAPWQVRRPIAR